MIKNCAVALSLEQESLREERADKEHSREEAKHLVRMIHARGHEVASHGYGHQPARDRLGGIRDCPHGAHSRAQFRRSTRARARCRGRAGSPQHRNDSLRFGSAGLAISVVGAAVRIKLIH